MGCMGMSMDDFCRCTPSEFYAAWKAWNEMQQSRDRGEWERLRMQCLCTLQPYSKKTLDASDIMSFPWETEQKSENEVKMDKEDTLRRYREAKAAAGLK